LNDGWPEETLHLNAESEFQMLYSHSVAPKTIVLDISSRPKLRPSMVNTVLPDCGAFVIIVDEITGMLNVSPLEMNSDCSPMETDSEATALPAPTFADIDENDAHIERLVEVPEILNPGDISKAPNPSPTTTTNEFPVEAALACKDL
jgi:hypothetical protein